MNNADHVAIACKQGLPATNLAMLVWEKIVCVQGQCRRNGMGGLFQKKSFGNLAAICQGLSALKRC